MLDPIHRARANRELLNRTRIGDKPENELAAFMELFHPNHRLTKASPAELREVLK